MRTVLSGFCLLIATIAFAQRECANSSYIDNQKSSDPGFPGKINEIEQFVQRQKYAKTDGQSAPQIIRIPVVVHVLYKNATQNISDEQIISQIDILNRDFRRRNADTNNTPLHFRSVAADVQIEFEFATVDPKGRGTNGIVRKMTSVGKFTIDDKIKFSSQGGDDAWDRDHYLNIWVGDLGSLLGYSSIPGAPGIKDGVVINYTAFGTVNTGAPYNLGRTTTHEVGHWLGLRHIWGDNFCGDDLVDDTPRQGNFTPGCPTTFRSSCSNDETGDMYMNYMDFTNDACMNMFSAGQKQRIWSMFAAGGPRNALLTSKGLSNPWLVEIPIEEKPQNLSFKFFPNPAQNEMLLNFEYNDSWMGKTISIVDINGVVVSRVQVTAKSQKINLASLKAGMYFILGQNTDQKLRAKFIKL